MLWNEVKLMRSLYRHGYESIVLSIAIRGLRSKMHQNFKIISNHGNKVSLSYLNDRLHPIARIDLVFVK